MFTTLTLQTGIAMLESVKGWQSLLRSRAADLDLDFVEWTDGRAPHGGRSTSDPLGSQPTNCRRIKAAPGFVPVGESRSVPKETPTPVVCCCPAGCGLRDRETRINLEFGDNQGVAFTTSDMRAAGFGRECTL